MAPALQPRFATMLRSIRRAALALLLLAPLGGCHQLMGAATGLSRPTDPGGPSADERCVGPEHSCATSPGS